MDILYIPILISLIVGVAFVSNRFWPLRKETPIKFMHLDYTTTLKGVAIILIMLSHFSGHWPAGRILTPCGGIGVSLFLIVSGYGLNESYKKRGLASFWKKRIVRVWMPYAIITLCFELFMRESFLILIERLLCIKCIYWFVPYVLGYYVLFWLSSTILPRKRIVIIALASFFVAWLCPQLQAEQAFGFITGILLSEKCGAVERFVENKNRLIFFIIVLLFVGLGALGIKQLPSVRSYENTIMFRMVQFSIIWPLSMAILLSLQIVPKIVGNPYLFFTGTISYELYLIHFRFYGYIKEFFWPAIVVFVGSYLCSYFFYIINTKITYSLT